MSYESEKEESDKPGSESGSAHMFGSELGGLLHDVGFFLGVTLSADESGHCLSHKKLLGEWVPNTVYLPNVPDITIYFLLYNYLLSR